MRIKQDVWAIIETHLNDDNIGLIDDFEWIG